MRQTMRQRFMFSALGGAAIVALLAFATPSYADTVQFKADLKGSNEVPPTQSPGTGSLTATYDTSSKVLTWDGSYSGTTGPVTAAHFHGPAEPGKNAGVAVPIPAARGRATLTDTQAADLMAGRWYVNVHTQRYPGGELRGQLNKM